MPEKIIAFESKTVLLPVDNIDTDQIIPARFLKTISKDGLGDQLFFDWRYEADGSPKADFVLNTEAAQGCAVLVAGDNFGCGSSREHAPWALTQFGFKAVISTSFADIFKNNSLKNGLLPLTVPKDVHEKLLAAPSTVKVDLEARTLTLAGGTAVEFPIDAFSRMCLLEGIDELGFVLKHDAQIAAYEAQREGTLDTRALSANRVRDRAAAILTGIHAAGDQRSDCFPSGYLVAGGGRDWKRQCFQRVRQKDLVRSHPAIRACRTGQWICIPQPVQSTWRRSAIWNNGAGAIKAIVQGIRGGGQLEAAVLQRVREAVSHPAMGMPDGAWI